MSRGLHALYRTIADICLHPARHPCGAAAARFLHDVQSPQSLTWAEAASVCYACQAASAFISTVTAAPNRAAEQHAAASSGARAPPGRGSHDRRSHAHTKRDAERPVTSREHLPITLIVHKFKAGRMRHACPPCHAADAIALHCSTSDGPSHHDAHPLTLALQAAEDLGNAERMRSLMEFMAASGTRPQVRCSIACCTVPICCVPQAHSLA